MFRQAPAVGGKHTGVTPAEPNLVDRLNSGMKSSSDGDCKRAGVVWSLLYLQSGVLEILTSSNDTQSKSENIQHTHIQVSFFAYCMSGMFIYKKTLQSTLMVRIVIIMNVPVRTLDNQVHPRKTWSQG